MKLSRSVNDEQKTLPLEACLRLSNSSVLSVSLYVQVVKNQLCKTQHLEDDF